MLDKIMLAINKYSMLSVGEKILCAVSGGADSVAMVHLLASLREKLGFTLCAAHFIHGLRPENAAAELELVQDLCSLLGIELLWEQGDTARLANDEKIGVEEAARKLRYEFLQSAAKKLGAQKIATAHHMGDNAETVMLNLARGTAMRGICGVPPVRENIIRPMIYLSRRQIEQYLAENIINYATDPTNASDIYARNKIRHAVMPELEKISPNAEQKILQMSESMREASEYLERCAAQFLCKRAKIRGDFASVRCSSLAGEERAVSTRAIMQIFQKLGICGASQKHVEAVLALCDNENPSAKASLPNGFCAQRNYEKIVFCKIQPKSELKLAKMEPNFEIFAGNYAITLDGRAQMGDTVYTMGDSAVDEAIFVRTRKSGDEILWNGHHKSVKKLMIEAKIPAGERNQIPLICAEDRVLFICGVSPKSGKQQTGRKIIVRKICKETGGAR